MSEKRTVPAFYPDFNDAEKWKSWDGTREAEMWSDLLAIRDRVIVETAATVMLTAGEGADVGGLMVALWSLNDAEIAGVMQVNMEQITRAAEES